MFQPRKLVAGFFLCRSFSQRALQRRAAGCRGLSPVRAAVPASELFTFYPHSYPQKNVSKPGKNIGYPHVIHSRKKSWPEMERFQHNLERNQGYLERNQGHPERNRGAMEKTEVPWKRSGAHRRKTSTAEFFQGGRIREAFDAPGFADGAPF